MNQSHFLSFHWVLPHIFALKRILIKTHCYSVTMVITNFVRAALNRVLHGELADTKFADFKEVIIKCLHFAT